MSDGNTLRSDTRSWLRRMASPTIVFLLLPWLMVLLIAGTLAQKDMGLFVAQNTFFSSWVFWLGPLPLPGGYPTIGLLTLCLLAKFLLYSPWNKNRAGTILTHLGVLILLIGGIITAFTQKEGYMILKEGMEGSQIADFYSRALKIEKDGTVFAVVPFENLKDNQDLPTDLPFKMHVDQTCRNCSLAKTGKEKGRQGLAAEAKLVEIALDNDDEKNLSGATLSIVTDTETLHYIVMEEIPEYPEIKKDGHTFRFSIGRTLTDLPFSIKLIDFERSMHPGTDMARAYSSKIVLRDGGAEWPYHIHMNNPLRYKGYTFYQSSFSERPDGEYSILSVVENKGRVFPYLASAIIFLGLLVHVVVRLHTKRGHR